MRIIPVNASVNYQVIVGSGLLAELGLKTRALGGAGKVMLVSDDTVYALYGAKARESLLSAGFEVAEFVFAHGEESKNLSTYGALLREMARVRLTRSDVLAALGGGVVGDLAGFAAATYERGIRFVQVPTTLLAAVDSSVGGKTAVDLPEGKNLVGAFHQPSLVLMDTDTLSTLPEEQYLSGAAETLKYGVIGRAAFFDRMADTPIFNWVEEAIEQAVTMKRDLVEEDEYDRGKRMLLNFGHTFGHAAEAASGYGILHGQAVAMGMATVTRAAVKMGRALPETAEVLENVLKRYGLPTVIPFRKEELLPHLLLDKKMRGRTVSLIVPKRIGECEIVPTDADALGDWLTAGGVQ